MITVPDQCGALDEVLLRDPVVLQQDATGPRIARGFVSIHLDIGASEQACSVASVGRIDAHTDAARQLDSTTLDKDRALQRVTDSLPDARHVEMGRHVGEKQHKLIAPNARNRIMGAHAVGKACSDQSQ